MLRASSTSQLSPMVNNNRGNTMDKSKYPVHSPPAQNVAFAVNYSLPSVEQFLAVTRKPRTKRGQADAPDDTTDADLSASTTPTDSASNPTHRTHLIEKDMNRGKRVTVVETPAKRVSQRDRTRREKAREKVRIKYDVNMVPTVQRHLKFVHHHRSQANTHHHRREKKRALPPRRCSDASTRTARETAQQQERESNTCHKCKGEELPEPFVEDSSIVWIPTKRSEWEDCLSEMTAVCTSAALRRHVASEGASTTKPFFAPLSQSYIRDRIDIDDPLEGYQIRHNPGGWLQGFILWTNFTEWTHYFKWDSLHEMSGIQSNAKADKTRLIDADGSLSKELEAQPRSGDPLAAGVVFPTIAEISLLGGIGCGEYLLRMALDDIKSRDQYKYVVMQATDQSRSFYERFGFVRVGAVCRYGTTQAPSTRAQQDHVHVSESETVGYRHWTYANERNLDSYGGPSYMMALRLPTNDADGEVASCPQCDTEVAKPTVIDQLKAVAVEEKPKITQLGAAATPFKKRSLTPVSKLAPIGSPSSSRRTRQTGSLPKPQSDVKRALAAESPAKTQSSANTPKRKRRRTLAAASLADQREQLMTPPREGQKLSFAQKQYQSVWLAVPPKNEASGGRRPPRARDTPPELMPSKRKRKSKSQDPS